MFNRVKDFFQSDISLDVDTKGNPTDKDVQLAVGVLLLEMAGVDQDYDPVEVKTVFAILELHFGMTDSEVLGLLEDADRFRQEDGKIDVFVNAVNENFDVQQRQLVLSMLWRVVMADGKIEKTERRLMTQFQNRLKLTDEQAQQAMRTAEGK